MPPTCAVTMVQYTSFLCASCRSSNDLAMSKVAVSTFSSAKDAAQHKAEHVTTMPHACAVASHPWRGSYAKWDATNAPCRALLPCPMACTPGAWYPMRRSVLAPMHMRGLQKSFLVTSVAAESFRIESMIALRTSGGNRGSDAIRLSSGSVLMASANCAIVKKPR